MQGSAASGRKYKTGQLLNSRKGIRPRDYDVAIVSPKLLAKAKKIGLNILDGSLTSEELSALGLSEAQRILTSASKGGIEVNFKLFQTIQDVYNADKTILFLSHMD